MLYFIKQEQDNAPYDSICRVEMQVSDDSTLNDMIGAIKRFLLACGWPVNLVSQIGIQPPSEED